MITKNRAARAVAMSLLLFVPLGAFAEKPSQVVVVNPVVPVEVSNADPIPVTVAAAQTPFQIGLCTIGWPPGCLSTPNQFVVPGDKRLVIEYISGQCDTGDTADFVALIQVATRAGGTNVYHQVVPQFLGSASTTKLYGAAQQTRIYADPGTTVYTNASGVPTGDVGCLLSLSGYLVSP